MYTVLATTAKMRIVPAAVLFMAISWAVSGHRPDRGPGQGAQGLPPRLPEFLQRLNGTIYDCLDKDGIARRAMRYMTPFLRCLTPATVEPADILAKAQEILCCCPSADAVEMKGILEEAMRNRTESCQNEVSLYCGRS